MSKSVSYEDLAVGSNYQLIALSFTHEIITTTGFFLHTPVKVTLLHKLKSRTKGKIWLDVRPTCKGWEELIVSVPYYGVFFGLRYL